MKSIIYKILAVCLAILLFSFPVMANDDVFDLIKVNQIIGQTDIHDLKANSAILMDAETGKILFEYNKDEQRPMASITKVMTTLIIMEHLAEGKIDHEDRIHVSDYAYGYGGSQVYLAPGEVFTLREMLGAIEIHSANDATVAVAEHIAGSHNAFVQLMNEKAKELGMNDTFYKDSMGLTDDGQFSTANDIAILARELINEYPEVLEITTIIYEAFRPGDHQIDMYNRNRLVTFYPGATGLKTGFTTRAGYSLAGTAKRGGFHLIAVVLGCPDTNTRFAETAKLLDYGFLNFDYVTLEEQGIIVDSLPVDKGIELSVDVFIEKNSTFLMNKNDKNNIERVVELPNELFAPVEKDAVVGKVTYVLDDEELGSVDILIKNDVAKAGFFTRLWRTIKSWFGIN